MKFFNVFAVAIAALSVAGCSSTSHCKDEQDYQKAETVPPLQGVEGLKLPESPSPLRVPPKPESEVAFGEQYKTEKGKTRYRCLDIPPRLELTEEKAEPEAEAPAESKPEAKPAEKPKIPTVPGL